MEKGDVDLVREIDDKIAARAAQNAPERFLKDVAKYVCRIGAVGAIVYGTEKQTFAYAGQGDLNLFVKSKTAIPEFIGRLGFKNHMLDTIKKNDFTPFYQEGVMLGFRLDTLMHGYRWERYFHRTVNWKEVYHFVSGEFVSGDFINHDMTWDFTMTLDRKRKREICKPINEMKTNTQLVFREENGKLVLWVNPIWSWRRDGEEPKSICIVLDDIKTSVGVACYGNYFLTAMNDAGCVLKVSDKKQVGVSFETDCAFYDYHVQRGIF